MERMERFQRPAQTGDAAAPRQYPSSDFEGGWPGAPVRDAYPRAPFPGDPRAVSGPARGWSGQDRPGQDRPVQERFGQEWPRGGRYANQQPFTGTHAAASDEPEVLDWSTDSGAAVEELRSELAGLKARLSQAAPRRAVVEMDRAITLLHSRVETLRQSERDLDRADGAAAEGMARVSAELVALRSSLEDMRAPERFHALSAGVDVLARKIDIINARAVDPVEIARLQAQTQDMKALVTRLVSGAGLQPIAERLAACAEQIVQASDTAAQRVEEATFAFERNAEALLNRVAAYETTVRAEQAADAQDLRRDVAANMHGIHDRLDRVAEYLKSLAPDAGGELAARLSQVMDRLEGLRSADPMAGPLAEVVEHHLMALTDRFQDAHARLDRLDGIEATLFEMMDELRRARETSGAAVQEAADVAVEAVSRKVSTDPAGPAVLGLKRGLAALEARQNEVERKASEFLGETFSREIEDRTLDLGRREGDVWAPHPEVESYDAAPAPEPESAAPYAAEQTYADDAAAEPAYAEPAYAAALEPEPVYADEPYSEPLDARAYADDRRAPEPSVVDYDAPADAPPAFEWRSDVRPEMRADARPELRGETEAALRPKKVQRGRSSPAHVQLPNQRGTEARPRVDRRGGRPAGGKVSPAVIAAAGLILLTGVSGATAWVHRDAIIALASRAVSQMHAASGAPAAVAGLSTQSAGDSGAGMSGAGAASTAQLPPPTGPQPLRTAALEGNLAAAYEVGVRFADGVGIPQDVDAGIKWLSYAVSRGFVPAGYRLGSLYENTVRNTDEAFRYYKWAADQGNVRAMHNLGVLYSQGLAGPPDWSEALKWFRKAANLGLKDSQHNLGIIFARGFAGTSDLAEALTWFNIAARQGDQDSAEKRDALLREADEVVQARARKAADAFVAKPLNEAANVVNVLPEWNASEAGEHMAANVPAGKTITASNAVFSNTPLSGKR